MLREDRIDFGWKIDKWRSVDDPLVLVEAEYYLDRVIIKVDFTKFRVVTIMGDSFYWVNVHDIITNDGDITSFLCVAYATTSKEPHPFVSLR
jgi:hypothetical protein